MPWMFQKRPASRARIKLIAPSSDAKPVTTAMSALPARWLFVAVLLSTSCGDSQSPPEPAALSPTPSSYTLSGTITDAATGLPLSGARVEILDGQHRAESAASNGQGVYSLGQLLGNMNVSAAHEGYATERTGATLTQNTTLNFALSPLAPPLGRRVSFTLRAKDGFFQFSTALRNLSVGQSFLMSFRPLKINSGDSGFANTVEFWLDRIPAPGAIALSLNGNADGSQWTIGFFDDGFGTTGQPRALALGTLHRVEIFRRNDGVVEFFLDGESVLTLDDPKRARSVFARVVGAEAEFIFQAPSPLMTGLPDDTSRSCAFGSPPCWPRSEPTEN